MPTESSIRQLPDFLLAGFLARQTARCGSSAWPAAWLVPPYIDNRTCFGRLALPAVLPSCAAGRSELTVSHWSAPQPDALEPSYFRHPALGKTVSSHTRRNAVLLG